MKIFKLSRYGQFVGNVEIQETGGVFSVSFTDRFNHLFEIPNFDNVNMSTGYCDKHNAPIFTGDKVKVTVELKDRSGGKTADVIYDVVHTGELEFKLCQGEHQFDFTKFSKHCMEVIGEK